jgi:DNA repair protein RecO (recombination protein O)
MSGRQRVDAAAAFLLHVHPFSESSLILDVFSRSHGRLALLARGARRPRSALRGVLIGFQPLELGWFGNGEVKTLAKAEWTGGLPLLAGRCLLFGYYLNELLMKLLPREDAHPALFDAYGQTLAVLAREGADTGVLRQFEQTLLRELGYGLQLDRAADSGQPVRADRWYRYEIERGPVEVAERFDGDGALSGATLLALAGGDYTDERTAVESKLLMRQLMNHYLGGQALQSRRIFVELLEL